MPTYAKHADMMLGLRATRGGTVAFSLRQTCEPTNDRMQTPKTTNRAMIRPSDQGYLTSPHSSAKSRQITAGAIKMNPNGSSCLTLPSRVSARCSVGGVFGVKRTSNTSDTAPTGRLIQKHQRQVIDVRYPPRMGPMAEVIPNTEPNAPMYFGREARGTRKVIKRNAPAEMPAPPMPVMTRPTMSALELGAKAQTSDPISKMATSEMSTHFVE